MTDLFLKKYGETQFSWGSISVQTPIDVEGVTRIEYITSLKSADNGDFKPLIKFVRS